MHWKSSVVLDNFKSVPILQDQTMFFFFFLKVMRYQSIPIVL